MSRPVPERLAFARCLALCLTDPDLIEQYDRLRGTNLGLNGSPLDLMVDATTGRSEADVAGFLAFVKDCVWDRLPPEVRDEEVGR
jgi:hypothetical protein